MDSLFRKWSFWVFLRWSTHSTSYRCCCSLVTSHSITSKLYVSSKKAHKLALLCWWKQRNPHARDLPSWWKETVFVSPTDSSGQVHYLSHHCGFCCAIWKSKGHRILCCSSSPSRSPSSSFSILLAAKLDCWFCFKRSRWSSDTRSPKHWRRLSFWTWWYMMHFCLMYRSTMTPTSRKHSQPCRSRNSCITRTTSSIQENLRLPQNPLDPCALRISQEVATYARPTTRYCFNRLIIL